MILSEELYYWLASNQLISQKDAIKLSEDRFELSRNATLLLENGILYGRIAKYMNKLIAKQQRRAEEPLNLDNLKELNSPAAKIYNWNILVQVFRKFNVTVDPDVKSLIVSGDQELMLELLKELYSTSITWIPVQQDESQLGSQTQSQGNLKKNNKVPRDYKDAVDLSKLDPSKDPSVSKSCLEFLIIILSRHLELDPKQTASLFTHGNKYLAHVLAKGVKGLFDPIVGFFTEVYSNINHLIKLFNDDPQRKSMQFTLNALKPGLVSKSFDVAEWAARLFSKLAFEFGDNNLLSYSWEWFVGESGGLNTTLLSLKRHPDLLSLIVSTLLQFGQFNFVELFTVQLRKNLTEPKDFLNTLLQLFPPLMESKSSREEIIQAGILDDWIDQTFQISNDDYKSSPDLKSVSLSFLTQVWLIQPQKIEDQEYKANNLINLLAKATREKSQSLLYTSLNLQFKLLLQFGQDKNPYAPIIYKTLTLTLIELNSNQQVREFMLNNFVVIYDQIDNIPLHILLEPFIRQIQVSDSSVFTYNVFDFNFFYYISKYDRLQLKNAIQLLDLLAKIYLNNIIFAQMASNSILNLVRKNIDNETMHEFVIKFVKISLAMYYASEKKKKPKEKILPMYNNKVSTKAQGISPQELDNEILSAQKRSLIIQIIKSIVEFNHEFLNEKIKPLVAHTNIQIKNFRNKENNGMMSILALFGDPEQMMVKYEEEYKEHQSMLQQEEKDALEREQDILDTIDKRQFSIDNTKDETMMLIEANLNKYGIQNQLGYRNSQLNKDEITRLALLRNPKANPKVLKQLDDIKQNFSNKLEMEKRVQENNESMLIVQKKNLRNCLEKRSIEQGVSNQNQKDQQKLAIYEYGSRDKELKREMKYIPEIVYIDLKKEETMDQEMVQSLLKKYQKILKFIFMKYANTGYNYKEQHQSLKTFDELKSLSSIISLAETWRFIKDFDLEKIENDKHFVLYTIITLDENKTILRLVNQYGVDNKSENSSLEFPGFLLYFINLAVWVCKKEPFNLGHLPISYSIQFLIDRLRTEMVKKKQNTTLFDEPGTSFLGEGEVIKNYNKQLETNPGMVLPEGYKKQKERNIQFLYKFDQQVQLPESHQVVYSLLADILLEKFKMQIIEPKSKVTEVMKVQPMMNAGFQPESKYPNIHISGKGYEDLPKFPLNAPNSRYKASDAPQVDHKNFNSEGEFRKYMKDRASKSSQDLFKLLPGSTFDIVLDKYGKKKNLAIDEFHSLSLNMKISITQLHYKDRWVGQECAYVLDDVIKAIEKEREGIVKDGLFHTKNAVVNDKLQKAETKLQDKDKKYQRVDQLRQYNLKRVDGVNQKKQKDLEEKKPEQEQEEEKKKQAMEQKEKERAKWLEDQKKKAQQYTEENTKQKQDNEKQKLEQEKQKKDEFDTKFKEFNEKEKQKLKEKFDKIQEEKNKKLEDDKKKVQQGKTKREKLYKTMMQNEQKRKDYEKEVDQKIKELHNSEKIQALYKKNDKKLKYIFGLLCKQTFLNITSPSLVHEVNLKTWSWFCYSFGLYPDIIHSLDAILVFRSAVKGKQFFKSRDEDLSYVNQRKLEHPDEEFIQKLGLKGREKDKYFEEANKDLDKPGGVIPQGIDFEQFKQTLTRLAIKGKNVFNAFAQNLAEGNSMNQSDMQNIVENQEQEGVDQSQMVDQDPDKTSNRVDLENQQQTIDKYKLLVDSYGDVDQANDQTVQCLILYLGFPDDHLGMDERFKLAIQQSHYKNTRDKKKEIQGKSKQDPNSFTLDRMDANKSYMAKSKLLNQTDLKGVQENPDEDQNEEQNEQANSEDSKKR